ncbi:hypothetical protein BSPWISOXPB_9423 [uncultured Gammaproteobacteria bacterium]|nr:hypothetical protein BSPWISOXPB_2451 [uncultured Gammaproteobacteria bacterium]VVM19475.1 hypothetical protein BSPWISOXPB_9423 [uncultured Gammaproteobacteria bacterium]
MNDKTKIADATYGGDLSGLKLDKDKTYSVNEIYFFEAQNILKASLDYLGGVSNKKSDSFDTPKSKNRTTQTNPQSKPKKCTPFKPCLQQNTGIFSEFDKTGVNYPIFWMIWFFQVS